MTQIDGPDAQEERHEKNRQHQSDQRRSNQYKLTGLTVDPQAAEQTDTQQQSRQDDEVQQRSISIPVGVHFRSRKSFNGLRSFQLRSVPCSNSDFNSARSEERRVGKECRSRRSAYHSKKERKR